MSSSLFGRGTFSQVGGAHRAEQTRKEFDRMWEVVHALAEIPRIVEDLASKVVNLTARLDAMGAPKVVTGESGGEEADAPVTREELDEINGRLEALRTLASAPQITQASLNALEKRLNAKIDAVKPK